MGIEIGPVQIHEDNTSTIALAERGKSNKGMTKHVKVRYFLVKQYIDEGEIEIRHTRTEDMWADLLTKPVMGSTFWRLLSKVTGQNIQQDEYGKQWHKADQCKGCDGHGCLHLEDGSVL